MDNNVTPLENELIDVLMKFNRTDWEAYIGKMKEKMPKEYPVWLNFYRTKLHCYANDLNQGRE